MPRNCPKLSMERDSEEATNTMEDHEEDQRHPLAVAAWVFPLNPIEP